MEVVSRPRRPWQRAALTTLRLVLACSMAGCAGTAPPPTTLEARSLESRTIAADRETLLGASVNALQDLGYTIDLVNSDIGLITASRQTSQEAGEIREEAKDPDSQDGGPPLWASILLVVTGIFLVALVVHALSGDDDDGENNNNNDDGKGHRHHDDGDHGLGFLDSGHGDHDGPSGETIYNYRVTVNVQPKDSSRTHIRVSTQGNRTKGGVVEKAGPVNDPEFFQRFFTNLDKSLFLEENEVTPQ